MYKDLTLGLMAVLVSLCVFALVLSQCAPARAETIAQHTTDSPEKVCGSNLHCQWRVELFAAGALLDVTLDTEVDPDAVYNAANAHLLRAMDLCVIAGECTELEARTMKACMLEGCD